MEVVVVSSEVMRYEFSVIARSNARVEDQATWQSRVQRVVFLFFMKLQMKSSKFKMNIKNYELRIQNEALSSQNFVTQWRNIWDLEGTTRMKEKKEGIRFWFEYELWASVWGIQV